MRVKDWSENLLAQRGWVATSWPCFLAGDTRDMPLPSSQNQEISNFSTHPSFPSWVSSLSNCKLLRGQFHQLAIYCLCPQFKVQLSWAVLGVSEYNQNIPQQPSPTIAYRCTQHVLFAPNTNEYSTSGGTEAFPLTERVIWTLASSVSPEHWREGVAMHHLGLSAQTISCSVLWPVIRLCTDCCLLQNQNSLTKAKRNTCIWVQLQVFRKRFKNTST